MKIPIQYLHDEDGKVKAVQIPVSDWEKVLTTLRKYDQVLHMRSELKDALKQVAALKDQKRPKQTLLEFLNEF